MPLKVRLYYPLYIVFALLFWALPLMAGNNPQFVENKGQWNPKIKYQLSFHTGSLLLEQGKVSYTLLSQDYDTANHVHPINKPKQGFTYRVEYVGSNLKATLGGEDAYPYHHNYYLGNDKSKWASDVPVFNQVRYTNLYNGIDLVYKGSNGLLEYSFEVKPGANPSIIKMHYEGLEGLSVKDGELTYNTTVTPVREAKLLAYQLVDGNQKQVACAFTVNGNNVGFAFPQGYDHRLPLVIDPILVFSTFTGSTQDNFGFTATYDIAGNAYAGGIGVSEARYGYITHSTDGYPIVGAFQTRYGGGDCDVTLSKLNPTGTALLYSTYLGGTGSETPNSMVVNHKNELLVYGETSSPNFPVTHNAFDTVFHGGVSDSVPDNGAYFYGGTDIYITKLDSNGHLLSSTLFGGSGNDGFNIPQFNLLAYNYSDYFRGEIQVDTSDNVFVASCTSTPKLYPAIGSAIRDSLIGRQDGLLFKMSPNLDSLRWQAYIGGSDIDALYSLDLDNAGNVYVAGGTMSSDFQTSANSIHPTQPGDRDGLLAKVNASGTQVLAASYLGTSAYDQAFFVKLGPDSNVYVMGQSLGQYPVTAGKYNNPGGTQFIHCLKPTLDSTIFSTVFGSGTDSVNISPTAFLVDECGFIYIAGWGGYVNHPPSNPNPATGYTYGLPITSGAILNSTFGNDFYVMVLSYHADSLTYATFMGISNANSKEHVDGGTSRFDPRGIIYEAVCAGCSGWGFFTTPGVVSQKDSSFNCNEAVFKLDLQIARVKVQVQANPATVGCTPLNVNFNSNGVNASAFRWYFGDGDTSILPNPVHVYPDTGTYRVKLIGYNDKICPAKLQIDSSFVIVRARNDSLVASFIKTVSSGCDSLQVQLTNTSLRGSQYTWDFGDGTTSTSTSVFHVYHTPGTYQITMAGNNPSTCNGTDTARTTVTLKPRLKATINALNAQGCAPLNVSFNPTATGGNSPTYQWNFGDGSAIANTGTPSHIYTQVGTFEAFVTVTDTSSCNGQTTDSIKVTVTKDTLTSGFILTVLKNVCDTLTVQLTDTSHGATSLTWYFGDGTSSTLPSPTHSYYQPDTFHILQVVGGSFCKTYDTARANVVLLPKVKALFTPQNGCIPYSYQPLNNSTNATSYLWKLSNGDTSTNAQPTLNIDSIGVYRLQLTAYNPNSCNGTNTYAASLQVFTPPTAMFSTDSITYQLFHDIQFNNQSSSPASYNWNFGDGNSTADVSPIHRYRQDGTVQPCLTVTDSNQCKAEYCKTLDITFIGVIDVPNAFSPNNDGINDVLYVKGYGVEEMVFRIYNRWGELVFESHNLADGWDGTYKGSPQEMEVYVYTLEGKFKNGVTIPLRKGNISLLR